MREPVELHELEERVHALRDRRFGRPVRARTHAQAEGDVLEDREMVEQRVVLEDEAHLALARVDGRGVFAVERHAARIGVSSPR